MTQHLTSHQAYEWPLHIFEGCFKLFKLGLNVYKFALSPGNIEISSLKTTVGPWTICQLNFFGSGLTLLFNYLK